MNELFINDETLGEPFIGTRQQFKAALMDQFRRWHAESNTPMTLDAFIDSNLDDYLYPATDADIELYPGIS